MQAQLWLQTVVLGLGGAVGDALGAPLEFMGTKEMRGRYGRYGVTGMVAGVRSTTPACGCHRPLACGRDSDAQHGGDKVPAEASC